MVLDSDIERAELLRRLVLMAIESGSSKTVKDVVSEIHQRDGSFSPDEIVSAIQELERVEKLSLIERSNSFWRFFAGSHVDPLQLLMMVGAGLSLFALTLPQSPPWSIIRASGALAFLLFSPGYALIEFAFSRRHLDLIERIALSVGISIVIVALSSVLVAFEFGRFNVVAVVVTLATFTVVLSLASKYRDFRHWMKLEAR